MKPAIITSSPVWTKARVLMLSSSEAGVGDGVGVAVGVTVGVGVTLGFGVEVGVGVAVAVAVAVGVGVGVGDTHGLTGQWKISMSPAGVAGSEAPSRQMFLVLSACAGDVR